MDENGFEPNDGPIDLVIFDMAGTTVYDGDAVNRSLAAALEQAGVEASRNEINAVMGISKPVAIRTLLESRAVNGNAVLPEEVDRIHLDFQQRMLDYYKTSSDVREIDGAAVAMELLKRNGLKIALDTGFSRNIADSILNRLGWIDTDLVDATVCSDEVPNGRPHPDMVLRAMALTGVTDPLRVAKVGDTPSDLHEGVNAGCSLVIGVTEGSHTRQELGGHPHTHLVGSVADVPALVLANRR